MYLNGLGTDFTFLLFVFIFIVILLLLLYLVESSKLVKIYKGIPEKTSKIIYGYLDKKGNLISLNEDFFNDINISSTSLNWKKNINNIFYNGKVVSYKNFLKLIKYSDEVINFVFEVEGKNYNISFKKTPIFEKRELCGYVLFNELYTNDQNTYLLDMLEEIQIPIAYFSGKTANVNLIINDNLKERLGVKEEKMTYNDLKRFVFEEDLEMFLNSNKEIVNDIRVQYRLKTINGLEYFEEVKNLRNEECTIIITLIESKEEVIWEENNVLFDKVYDFINEGTEFGGIILSYSSLLEEALENKNVLAKDIVKKHLKEVKKKLINEDDLITKVSDFEYILLFNNKDKLDDVVNEIYNGESILLDFEIGFAGDIVNLKNKLGIAYSSDEYETPDDFIKGLNSSLALANNEDYYKNYSIHTTAVKEKVSTIDEIEEYSFEKCLIDLDNTFLDE